MSPSSPKKQGGVQIRFVATDGQPQTKRRRVNAACRTCRKRKIRCSGEQPECKTCSNYGHKCQGYSDPPNLSSSSSTAASAQPENELRSPEIKKSVSPQLARTRLPSSVSDNSQHVPDSHSTPGTHEPRVHGAKDGEPKTAESPESTRSALISSNRTHVPYFRYFGPTAIVPGFKQMVVRVRESRKGNPSISDSISSGRGSKVPDSGDLPSSAFTDSRMSHSIPFYDPEDSLPVSGLIMHLCEIFFTHLGCNFPFLQRDRFLRDLKEKQIEPILVDAVCALAARFSLHPLLATQQNQGSGPGSSSSPETKHADQGQLFAHRAMCAVVDAFSCPTLAVVQACLLLAYEEFGSNHDSGLWMYLGISIRMAQDLGLQKLEGMKYKYGCIGLTPKLVKSGQANNFDESPLREALNVANGPDGDGKGAEDIERAKEREKVDSFWSIFFLDRVISSGTGRPVTLRDDDIEIFFPLQSESDLENGWPSPFPHLMRIIHLYGRITDLLNAIKEINHVTPETLRMLAGMESDLTGIYQRLSPKLHFNAVNFQTYIKSGEGTNFILLHFWFHTLIVLLHQPTLLHSFGGKIQQLFPNSRELSMSSAKTIADILAFAELIDAKSFIGNPFTSQPIYIAACAFLMESALYSMPSSRAESPPPQSAPAEQPAKFTIPVPENQGSHERSSNPKHTLLASAAKDNYQRCYKALKSLEVYWEGVKYILTVLDQKAKGIGDPQLYTEEEMENTAEQPEHDGEHNGEPLPGWKRTAQQPPQERPQKEGGSPDVRREGQPTTDDSAQRIDPSQAIGWALTGQTDSSQPNVSFLYQLPASEAESTPQTVASFPPQFGDNYQAMQSPNNPPPQPMNPYSHIRYPSGSGPVSNHEQQNLVSPAANYSPLPSDMSPPDAKYRVPVNSNYSTASQNSSTSQRSFQHDIANHQINNTPPSYTYDMSPVMANRPAPDAQRLTSNPLGGHAQVGPPPHGLTIESQDVDMNALHGQNSFPFTFDGEFIPWLEYLPQDVLSYFGYNQNYRPMMNPEDTPGQPPPSV